MTAHKIGTREEWLAARTSGGEGERGDVFTRGWRDTLASPDRLKTF